MNVPVYRSRVIADSYNAGHGLDRIVKSHYVPVDVKLAEEIYRTYENLPTVDYSAETVLAYTMLGREIEQQYNLASHMGIVFEPWTAEGQPYKNSAEMCNDVALNNRLYFFTGGEIHPFLGVTTSNGLTLNDKFRAVHDLFGHSAEGYQFGPRGEENAWIHHSMMFSRSAQRALSVETRAQNSWVNFGEYKDLPPSERPYAVQKCALLPERLTDWRSALNR